MDYARTRIGSDDVLLPQTGSILLAFTSGAESTNLFEFTHCRSFHAESKLRFDEDDAPAPEPSTPASGPKAPRPAAPMIPAGLAVRVKLTAPIHEKQAVGELIEAVVDGDVIAKGRVVIASGAKVRGRIRRLEWSPDLGGHFAIGIEFTEVATAAGPSRFFASLQGADRLSGLSAVTAHATSHSFDSSGGASVGRSIERITLPDLPGVGSFFFREAHFVIPAGFGTLWKTEAP